MVKVLKATIIDVIVAFLIITILLEGINLLYGQKISEAFSLVNKVSIDISNKEETAETVINEQEKN